MAVRLWTHGYDLYHPNRPIVYHNWSRKERKTHFDDHKSWPKTNKKSYARVRHLLGIEESSDAVITKDLEKYGLGIKRSVEAYQQYSGVDFSGKTFSDDAYDGYFGKKKNKPAKKARPAPKKKQKKLPKIFVQIASYRDRECQYTVKDLFDKATHPERLSVGVVLAV